MKSYECLKPRGPINFLKLCKYQEFMEDFGEDITKVYVILGEFSHVKNHVLLMNFETFEIVHGMRDLNNLEILDSHPDDVLVNSENDYESV